MPKFLRYDAAIFRQILPTLYSLSDTEACNEFTGCVPALLSPGCTTPSKKRSRLPAVGNTMSDLIGPRFEPQTYRFKDERVTARPTVWFRYAS